MPQIKHISFDLDGTLIDSFPIMKLAWESATTSLNINCSFLEYKKHVGMPFSRILELLDLSGHENELAKIYFSHTKRLSGDVALFQGVNDVLSALKKMGLSTSIITAKPRENAELLCAKLNIPFDFLVCGDDHHQGKPNAFVADALFEKFSLVPAEVVYVGDMAVDFQFAINVGMHFIHCNGNGESLLPRNIVNKFKSIRYLVELLELVREDFSTFVDTPSDLKRVQELFFSA